MWVGRRMVAQMGMGTWCVHACVHACVCRGVHACVCVWACRYTHVCMVVGACMCEYFRKKEKGAVKNCWRGLGVHHSKRPWLAIRRREEGRKDMVLLRQSRALRTRSQKTFWYLAYKKNSRFGSFFLFPYNMPSWSVFKSYSKMKINRAF